MFPIVNAIVLMVFRKPTFKYTANIYRIIYHRKKIKFYLIETITNSPSNTKSLPRSRDHLYHTHFTRQCFSQRNTPAMSQDANALLRSTYYDFPNDAHLRQPKRQNKNRDNNARHKNPEHVPCGFCIAEHNTATPSLFLLFSMPTISFLTRVAARCVAKWPLVCVCTVDVFDERMYCAIHKTRAVGCANGNSVQYHHPFLDRITHLDLCSRFQMSCGNNEFTQVVLCAREWCIK